MFEFKLCRSVERLFSRGSCFHDFRDDGFVESVEAMRSVGDELLFGSFSGNGIEERLIGELSPLLNRYFCDDNAYRIEYSFDGIRGSVFSVGTIAYLINTTSEVVEVGEFSNSKITLLPSELVILNLGLAGVPFDLDSEGILSAVIHSEIDGLNYFDKTAPKAVQKVLPFPVDAANVFLDDLNFDDWVNNGFTMAKCAPLVSDALRDLLVQETFQKVDPQHSGDKKYAARYISKHSLFKPLVHKPEFAAFRDSLRSLFRPVLEAKPNPYGDNISLFSAPKAHFMEAHSDCADASPVIVIVYLRDEPWEETDGGLVSVIRAKIDGSKVVRDERFSPVSMAPEHGSVIVLNNTSPKFQHQVSEVLSDRKRYSIIFNLSMLTNPQWDVDFEERAGEYIQESMTLSDPTVK